MSALASPIHNNDTPGFAGVSFGCSADGLLVALAGDMAFAMAPAKDGRHYLVTGRCIGRPMSDWARSDFSCLSGVPCFDTAFRAKSKLSAAGRSVRLRTHLGDRRRVPPSSPKA